MRAGDHAAQRDTSAVNQERSLGALFPVIYWGSACCFAAAGRFGDAAVDGQVGQVESDDLVVGGDSVVRERRVGNRG